MVEGGTTTALAWQVAPRLLSAAAFIIGEVDRFYAFFLNWLTEMDYYYLFDEAEAASYSNYFEIGQAVFLSWYIGYYEFIIIR